LNSEKIQWEPAKKNDWLGANQSVVKEENR